MPATYGSVPGAAVENVLARARGTIWHVKAPRHRAPLRVASLLLAVLTALPALLDFHALADDHRAAEHDAVAAAIAAAACAHGRTLHVEAAREPTTQTCVVCTRRQAPVAAPQLLLAAAEEAPRDRAPVLDDSWSDDRSPATRLTRGPPHA